MRPLSAATARPACWLLASASVAALGCWSDAALAECTGTALVNIQASGGSSCFVIGPFTSTVAIAGRATEGGSVLTNENEDGVFSSFSFSTSGPNTPAVQADTGGLVTLNATTSTGTVTTTGVGSIGLFATGSADTDEGPVASQITVEGVTVNTSGAAVSGGPTANGVEIDSGAIANITNGSVTTALTANGAVGVAATSGGQITISGTTITSNGDGSQGLFVTGSGSSLTGSGLNVTANGNNDPVTGFNPGAASNNAFDDESPTGGTLSISSSTLTTTGTQSFGVFTADKGVTTLTDDTVTTKGDNAFAGVESARGGQTTITRGSVSTSGIGSPALFATGAGSSITATGVAVATSGNSNPSTNSSSNGLDVEDEARAVFSGGSINTAGNGAYAVVANSGGLVSLNGTTIGTTGNGSGGLGINGSGSEIDAAGVTIATTGAMDPVTGLHSYGVYNGPFGEFTSGGVAKLTDASISTQGVQMYGVITSTGGTTSILGGSIATAGTQANGVLAENGGTVTIGVSNSGATSVVTSGTSAPGVVAYVGGAVQITGATIATNGDGSSGLSLNGVGSSITATAITVTTRGGVDTATGNHADGAYNGPYPPGGVTSGGFLSLANSTVATSGAIADGVVTGTGGTTTISGGSVTTSGASSYAIAVNGGGAVTLNGTTISTTANGSGGFSVEGAGSTLTASGVSITTQGAFDPTSGDHSYGLYNGPSASVASGGVATLTDTTISTQGADMHDVVTGAGGSTTLIGTNLSTAGLGANGVFTNVGGVTNISGGSVNTAGQDAHALFVSGSGSQGNLSGAGTFTTTGSGAIGLYAALGGAISATGSTMTTIATSGGVSLATGLGAYGVNADGAGSSIKLGSATITTSGAGATGLYASDRAASGAAGTISAAGTLNVQTKNALADAVALQGNGATIAATGGGTISAAGTAIAFLGGTGQTATFDNFAIGNLSGDLVFADPSIATLNFNNTIANAGNNNLLNATAGSAFTLNANASMLTGAIRTDATSTSTINLTNNTTWNLTAASSLTNLNVTHSIIVFAPPGSGGAFKTLTVGNYAGNGANITMNVALSGSSSAGDQIIINGGKATGSTLLTINNVGGLGGQTSGNGIPLVLTKNGGSVSSDAFTLANTPTAGGFKYTLDETDNSFFLVSSPTATIAGVTNSVNSVAKAQQSQMITNRVLGSILLGATQQISCSSCGGGFASIGSFALGGSGRWSLSDTTTLIGGISYDQWSASGITVNNAPTVAAALVYDFVKWGSSRPFFEAGVGLTPYEQVNYSRTYPNGATTGYGYASATNRDASLFGRAGWVDRLTPIDEAAAYVDLGRSWMQTGGYSEQMTAFNPFPATVPSGLAALNTTRLGAQYTHLFNGNIEVNVGGAVAYGFGAGAGAPFNVSEFGTIAPGAISDSAWFEYGARVGYRMTDRLVVDAFVLGTAGGLAGNFVHGGVGVRYSF